MSSPKTEAVANASMVSTSTTGRRLIAIIGGDLEYSRRSSPLSLLADAGDFRARPAGRLVLAGGRPQATQGGNGTRAPKESQHSPPITRLAESLLNKNAHG